MTMEVFAHLRGSKLGFYGREHGRILLQLAYMVCVEFSSRIC